MAKKIGNYLYAGLELLCAVVVAVLIILTVTRMLSSSQPVMTYIKPTIAALIASGIVGISKILLSTRAVIGRFIAHAGWGAGAFTALLYDSSFSPLGIAALAVLMASLGESGLGMMLKIWRGAK